MGAAARTGSGTTGSGIRNDFSGWHEHQGSPQSGGSSKKGASFEERDHREALGRSRVSDDTKVCVIADGRGKDFCFALASGHASRSGALSQPDMKKQQRRSSRSSTSLPQQTGSSPNRP